MDGLILCVLRGGGLGPDTSWPLGWQAAAARLGASETGPGPRLREHASPGARPAPPLVSRSVHNGRSPSVSFGSTELANNSLPYLNGLCLILVDSPTTKGENLNMASWVLSFQSPTTSLVLVGTDATGSIMIGANVCVHRSQRSGAASIHRERSIQ